jgi:hypothetical protein
MAINPQETAEKYRRRASAARQDWERGINNLTEAPGRLAAAKKQKWQQNTAEAADRWAENVASVSLEEFKARALATGGSRYTQGVDAGAARYEEYIREAAPKIDAFVRTVKAMPNNTFQESIARMVKNAELMRSLKK